MNIGYARVSTIDQNPNLQFDALKEAGCKKVFIDKISGAKEKRNGLEECLNTLKKGDTLIVWELFRLGRNNTHLISVVNDLHNKGINFISLKEGMIDTSTPAGELIFNIFAALGQFNRKRLVERTKAGLSAARSRGKIGGRPKLDLKDPRIAAAKKLHADKTIPIKDILKTLNISKATLYRFLKIEKKEN